MKRNSGLFWMSLLFALCLGGGSIFAQKLTHSAVINGVKQRLIYSESSGYDRNDQLQQALDLLLKNNVISDTKDKEKEETYYFLANCYFRKGDFAEAYNAFQKTLTFGKKYWDKAEKLTGGTVLFSIKDGINDMKLKLYNQGNKAFSDAAQYKANPDTMIVLMNKAIDKFSLLLQWDPKAFINENSYALPAYGVIVNCYFKFLELEKDDAKKKEIRQKTIQCLEKMFEFDTNNLSIAFNIYQMYDALKDTAKSYEWIDKGLRSTTMDSMATVIKNALVAQKALMLDLQNKPDEAIKTYQDAIKASPNNSDLHFNLARLYLNRKDFEKALGEFKAIKKMKPDDAETSYIVADETYTAYQKNRSETVEKNGGSMNKKVIDLLKPTIEDAIKQIQDAASATEKQLTSTADKAETSYRLGKLNALTAQLYGDLNANLENKDKIKIQKPYFEKALPYLKDAVQLKPDHKMAWNFLGIVYTNLQNAVEAKKAFDQFTKLK